MGAEIIDVGLIIAVRSKLDERNQREGLTSNDLREMELRLLREEGWDFAMSWMTEWR